MAMETDLQVMQKADVEEDRREAGIRRENSRLRMH